VSNGEHSSAKPGEAHPQSTKRELWILVFDKVLLAMVAGVFAHFLSLGLQRHEKGIDYQQKLFEQRVDAYLEVLQAAEKARDRLRLYWKGNDGDETTQRLNRLAARWQRLTKRDGGFSASSSYALPDEVIEQLKQVHETWQKKSVHFSSEVTATVAAFVATACADLEKRQDWVERTRAAKDGSAQTPAPAEPPDANAWARASAAFEKLNTTLRQRLRLDGIILG
jgi:hypothetical protein